MENGITEKDNFVEREISKIEKEKENIHQRYRGREVENEERIRLLERKLQDETLKVREMTERINGLEKEKELM